jgi:photosystem II stability/assembly factor-like uncharacterized protein
LGVVAVVGVIGLVAWVMSRSSNGPPDAGVVTSDPGVVHVHGLGVNPADGDLYVATHSGLFRLPESGAAARVGTSYQDTMGFTVVGPNRFLGSGHPDLRDKRFRVEGKPPLLGLIETTDAGRTWTALSLLGDADFHGLAFAGDRVYGWNASTGEFMASADMRTWETRSRIDLSSFAVDPRQPDRVVGARPGSVVVSTDAGSTWSPTRAPALVVLAWDDRAGLLGIEANGAVHHSRDGATWRRVGDLPGEPQALLAADDEIYAAAHDAEGRTAIYRSSDSGGTWQMRYRDLNQ